MTFRPQVMPDAATARQIIDAGVRALALKLHPDVGGSHEGMGELNACAALLRALFPKPKPVRKLRPETILRHSDRNFLRQESPVSRDRRRMRQSSSWGVWVGDGVLEEWLTRPAHPIYFFDHPGHYDIGAPAS